MFVYDEEVIMLYILKQPSRYCVEKFLRKISQILQKNTCNEVLIIILFQVQVPLDVILWDFSKKHL